MTSLGTKSLTYFRELRKKNLEYESDPDSRVLKVKTETGEDIRMLHVQSFGPLTDPGVDPETGEKTRTIRGDYAIFFTSPGFMGVRDFNNRNSSIVSDLGDLTKDCNVYLTVEMLDTQVKPSRAVEQFYGLQAGLNNTLAKPIPGATIGPGHSNIAGLLANIAGIYHIPMISGGATSSTLDNKFTAPSFARTIPTTSADAEAAVFYLKDQLHVTHVGLIFIQGSYGESFRRDFVAAANDAGIKLIALSYDDRDPESLRQSLEFLKSTDYRYFVGIAKSNFMNDLLEAAYDNDLVGPEYVWVLPTAGKLAVPGYKVPRDRPGLAEALRGAAVVTINTQLSEPFSNEMVRAITQDKDFQDFFISSHPESFVFDNYNLSESTPVLTAYSNTFYDAGIALGLAACQAEKDFFTPAEHYQHILNVSFHGASGLVGFDRSTGTRSYDTVRYTVINILPDDEANDPDNFVFQPHVTAVIDFNENPPLVESNPFTFNSGTTDIPAVLPPLEEDLNLIPNSIRSVGWVLSIGILSLSAAFAVWAFVKRKEDRVRAAQPFYLGSMCLGTALMATSIIPMSLQDPAPQDILDGSCMATMWLFALGFAVAFGSVTCKLIRVSRIFQAAIAMNRVTISIFDVIWPLCLLIAVNSIILCVWTIASPLRYERVESGIDDQYGRSTSSYGSCQGSSSVYVIALGVVNVMAVAVCNYKAYRSRAIPSSFNESVYIAFSNFFLLEGLLIFAPILLLVVDNPTADFLIRSLLITFICLAILLPIFLSKIFRPSAPREQPKPSTKKKLRLTRWLSLPEPGFNRGESSVGLRISRHEDISATDQIHKSIAEERAKKRAAAETADMTSNFSSRFSKSFRVSNKEGSGAFGSGAFGEHSSRNLGSSVRDLKSSIRFKQQDSSSFSVTGNEPGALRSGALGSSVSDLKASIRLKGREHDSSRFSLDGKDASGLGSSVKDLKEGIRLRKQDPRFSLEGHSSGPLGSSVADLKASIRQKQFAENSHATSM